jgi:hypothetical protein
MLKQDGTIVKASVAEHLFVDAKNQAILWKIIHTSPLFVTKINLFSLEERSEMFKQSIALFYDSFPEVHDFETLQKTNKAFLLEFLELLQEKKNGFFVEKKEIPYPSFVEKEPDSFIGKQEEQKVRQETFSNAFQDRQREFESFFEKPPTQLSPFLEPIHDEPISNMEEIIEQHKRERENIYEGLMSGSKIV